MFVLFPPPSHGILRFIFFILIELRKEPHMSVRLPIHTGSRFVAHAGQINLFFKDIKTNIPYRLTTGNRDSLTWAAVAFIVDVFNQNGKSIFPQIYEFLTGRLHLFLGFFIIVVGEFDSPRIPVDKRVLICRPQLGDEGLDLLFDRAVQP